MNILLAGGGTLGPVTPLFALVEAWRKQNASVSFTLVGTPTGPERLLAKKYAIAFVTLPVTRLPRSISFEWLWLPFRLVHALVVSVNILRLHQPDVIIGAGGFTQVPLIWMGRLLNIPSFILQTDVRPLLSNRLVTRVVRHIFLGWKQTEVHFPSNKTSYVGVPVRASLHQGNADRAMERFHLPQHRTTLFVFGGGTGSMWLNESLLEIIPQLIQDMNVIHITGSGKKLESLSSQGSGYVVAEQLEDGLEDVYALADLVVARAGLGTISELSALKKPAILIPLPGSAQEENARVLEQAHAARVLLQNQTHAEQLLEAIRLLVKNTDLQNELTQNIQTVLKTDVADEIIASIRQNLDCE